MLIPSSFRGNGRLRPLRPNKGVRMKKLTAALAALAVSAPAALAASSTHVLKVSPNPAKAGTTVRLFGSVGTGCAKAFKGATTKEFAGIPAVFTKVGKHGKFSRKLKLSAKLKPRKYHVGGRC